MRQYEAVAIFPPQLAGDKLEEAKKNFSELVVKQGGKFTSARELGKRAFGYTVKKQKEGIYVIFDFELDPAKVTPLKRAITLTESILRTSILIKEPTWEPKVVPQQAPRPAKPPVTSRT